jgi:Holliday junction resolvasome RuvABC endonuclease subunit
MYFIGLDQALNNTGIAVTDGKKIVTTQLALSSKQDSLERIYKIEQTLDVILRQFKPQQVFMEGIYIPASRLKACSALIRVETCVQLLLLRKKFPFLSLPSSPRLATSWPKALNIAGPKEHCLELINPVLLDKTTSDHETDAVGILWAGLVLTKRKTVSAILRTRIHRLNAKTFRSDPSQLRNCFV